MNIIIIGCGKVGSELAAELDMHGHDVSIIDEDGFGFELLPESFSGFTTMGVPIDQDVLRRAGIGSCDALCAVTDNDNMNIMVTELAAKVFSVPKVFARIRDITKGEIFAGLGIHIVCPTKLVVNAACAAIEDETQTTVDMGFENHNVSFTTMEVPESLIGQMPEDITYEQGEILFAILRGSEMMFCQGNEKTEFIKGDKLIFAKKG